MAAQLLSTITEVSFKQKQEKQERNVYKNRVIIMFRTTNRVAYP